MGLMQGKAHLLPSRIEEGRGGLQREGKERQRQKGQSGEGSEIARGKKGKKIFQRTR